jgi:hypothetical protein
MVRVEDVIVRDLPPGVRCVAYPVATAKAYRVRYPNARRGLAIVASVDLISGGSWLHVSFSHRNRTPSWDDMVWVKETFIGTLRKSYINFPKKDEWINVNPYCLHLWTPLDSLAFLPDFTHAMKEV